MIMRNSVYSCPSCNTLHTLVLQEISLVTCKNCGVLITKPDALSRYTTAGRMPEDWSFIQIGTTGEYNGQPFTVVGRIRIQLRNDYKNFWCAEYSQGKCLWLIESFASFIVIPSLRKTFTGDIAKLKSGSKIIMTKDLTVTGEYVEKCEGIGYQGEIGPWKLFTAGFFVVQASRADGQTAIFFIGSKDDVEFVIGQKMPMDKLHLKKILEFNEWR